MHVLDQNPDGAPSEIPAGAPAAVVGIGASAGGLEALEEFFAATDPKLPLAYVVVQHLAPDFESRMEAILSRSTSLDVRRAEQGVALRAGTVHLIPPACNLELHEGRLELVPPAKTQLPNHAIDVFLTALAADQGTQAVAVILSGTGSDGTRGIQAIKSHGGRVLVQHPGTARFDGMPQSAIATGSVDVIDRPAELARALGRQHGSLARQPVRPAGPADAAPPRDPAESAQRPDVPPESLVASFEQHRKKPFTAFLGSAWRTPIAVRMEQLGIEDLHEYVRHTESNQHELQLLSAEFLRGAPATGEDFAGLRQRTLAAAARAFGERRNPRGPLRAWLHADGSPEQIWAAAMAIDEARSTLANPPALRLFVTAWDDASLRRLSSGVVPHHVLETIPDNRVDRCFRRVGDDWTVRHHLLDGVVFAVHDVVHAAPFPRCSLLMLRGILSRLKPAAGRLLQHAIGYAVEPGGALLVAPREAERLRSNPLFAADRDLPGVLWRNMLQQVRDRAEADHGGSDDPRSGSSSSQQAPPDAAHQPPQHMVAALQATVEQLRTERDSALNSLEAQRATNDELHSVNAELFREHGDLAARLDHVRDERDALRALLHACGGPPPDTVAPTPEVGAPAPWVAVLDRQGGPVTEAPEPPIHLSALPPDLVVDLVRAADETGGPAHASCSGSTADASWTLVAVPFRSQRARTRCFALGAWPRPSQTTRPRPTPPTPEENR